MSEKEINTRKGLYAKIILVNGHTMAGVIKEWKSDCVVLSSLNGEVVEIINPNRDVAAVVYMAKQDGTLLSEYKTPDNQELDHKPGDVEEISQVAKLRAETDRESIKQGLQSTTCSAGAIRHDSQLSILSSLANDSPIKG